MKFIELQKIDQLYFGYEDISRALGITPASARVVASRYTRQGILLRLKRNLYVLKEVWNRTTSEDKFRLANLGQVPSYISLMTALGYYQITTQIQRDFFESVALKRTKEINIADTVFRYFKLAPNIYGAFRKENGFFMATPEKALLDAFYLASYGRYGFDITSLEASKFDRGKIERLGRPFPLRTKNLLKKYGYLKTT